MPVGAAQANRALRLAAARTLRKVSEEIVDILGRDTLGAAVFRARRALGEIAVGIGAWPLGAALVDLAAVEARAFFLVG